MNRFNLTIVLLICLSLWQRFLIAQDSSFRDEGLRTSKPTLVAIRGATIHIDGSRLLESASVLIQNEKIIAVGNDIAIPDGSVIVEANGKHLYPGLIDSYVPYSGEVPAVGRAVANWNPAITPQLRLDEHASLQSLNPADRRAAGFTTVLVAPTQGVIRGTSFLAHLNDPQDEFSIARRTVAMQCRLTINPSFGEGVRTYPASPMGAYALARQTIYDAQWYRDAWRIAQNKPQLSRPETNDSLEALQPVLDGRLPIMVETSNELFSLRARRFADEFGLKLILLGSGNEYRRLAEIAATKTPIIVPLDFPRPPKVTGSVDALDVNLETLMHWDLAPQNPAQLIGAGVTVAFTTNGLRKPMEWRKNLERAIARGLDPGTALDAWTIVPAKLFGIDDQLGTIEAGKVANFVMTDLGLFEPKSKILETWVLGRRFESEPSAPRQFNGIWQLHSPNDPALSLYLVAREAPKLSATVRKSEAPNPDVPDIEVKSVAANDTRLSATFEGEKFGRPGTALVDLVIDKNGEGIGRVVFADGLDLVISARRIGEPEEKPTKKRKDGAAGEQPDDAKPSESTSESSTESAKAPQQGGDAKSDSGEEAATEDCEALYPVNFPLGDFGKEQLPQQTGPVLFKNATVWTCGERGTLENASVLVDGGVIVQVFASGETLPQIEAVVDATGMHLTPGIIDCHSHMATDSGINEGTQAVTAEVRIGDFIDCDDLNIIRQLAGGVTCVNVLHGSANPIGGQNQVLKLRWGLIDEQLKFAEAPAGIKFALGENVKRSNSQTPSTRYPRTRMGVEQIMHDEFRAAQQYQVARNQWDKTHRGLPPRRDLELDAISEILDGKRWIHCHSYRQDEILALIRVLDQYGIQIGTFQHILEGYKVADAMAAHGAMASAFADWWAYKIEVYDAIPHAGAIMHDQGLCVSFNSDDAELARHLNHEAAKAVRYGGVSEIEALKFVTLNPARQLRIDTWVGSIDSGKHADLALWNGHPLDVTSRCEQTWVDGVKYFDRAEQLALSSTHAEMRAKLIQKVLASKQQMHEPGEEKVDPAELWPRYDEYCHGHTHDHNDPEDDNN